MVAPSVIAFANSNDAGVEASSDADVGSLVQQKLRGKALNENSVGCKNAGEDWCSVFTPCCGGLVCQAGK